MATPLLCRVEGCTASKATSSTRPGDTARTGPKRSVVWSRTPFVEAAQLGIREARVGLAYGHEFARARGIEAPGPECIVRIVGRPLSPRRAGRTSETIEREGGALPLEPLPLDATGLIGAVLALEHEAFDALGRGVHPNVAQAVEGVEATVSERSASMGFFASHEGFEAGRAVP